MSKHTLGKEIQKELRRINDRIDHKIIRGLPFRYEARRHKELFNTLQQIHGDITVPIFISRRTHLLRSPVRGSLAGGALRRIFTFGTM